MINTPKHGLSFPDIQQLVEAVVPVDCDKMVGAPADIPYILPEVLEALQKTFGGLGEVSAKFLGSRLPAIAKAVVSFIENERNIKYDADGLGASLAAAAQKSPSLLDGEIVVKNILKRYRTSAATKELRQKKEVADAMAGKPEVLRKSANLLLVKLCAKDSLQNEALSLGHYMDSHKGRRRFSRGEIQLYAIKGIDASKMSIDDKHGIGKSYFTIEFDTTTKELSKIRGYKNTFMNRKMTYFTEVIYHLLELIKITGAETVRDVSSLESTLETTMALTFEGLKPITNLTMDDKVIASGLFEFYPGLFSVDNLLHRVCTIPNLQINFTKLSPVEKDTFTKVAGIIVDHSHHKDVIYKNLQEAGGIRVTNANSVSFPELHTTGDFIYDASGNVDLPKLQRAKNLDIRYSTGLNIDSLKEISGNIRISSGNEKKVPEHLKEKIK